MLNNKKKIENNYGALSLCLGWMNILLIVHLTWRNKTITNVILNCVLYAVYQWNVLSARYSLLL